MALTPRLDIRQTQALVMTPQLQQAIKLLQLSNIELSAYVEEQIEQNPLLDREDAERGDDVAGEEQPQSDAEEPSGEPVEGDGLATVDLGNESLPTEDGAALDVDYDNLWNNDSASDGDGGEPIAQFADWGGGGDSGFEGVGPDLEQTLSREGSLRDYLIGQLNVSFTTSEELLVGQYLIDSLDESGYLAEEVAVVATALGCAEELVEAVLAVLQQFEPPGIFARSLAECLALQLRDKDRLDPAMQALLDNLDLMARHDWHRLARLCGVDAEDLADMVGEIRELNPRPASVLDVTVAPPVIPDVLMRRKAGGGWSIDLNSETLPRVLVNNRYHAEVSRGARTKQDRQYLSECLQSANWLVKSLHQRATTILKVATEIVSQQNGFFHHGVDHLRPLILRDIAEAIEMHESTVSRVTSNKFMATPRGIFELKYFFTTAIANARGGEAHSAEAVRHRIRVLIGAETQDHVLSDDKIVEILVDDGVDIARRTVAKYRDSMGIPSSVQRRREMRGRL